MIAVVELLSGRPRAPFCFARLIQNPQRNNILFDSVEAPVLENSYEAEIRINEMEDTLPARRHAAVFGGKYSGGYF